MKWDQVSADDVLSYQETLFGVEVEEYFLDLDSVVEVRGEGEVVLGHEVNEFKACAELLLSMPKCQLIFRVVLPEFDKGKLVLNWLPLMLLGWVFIQVHVPEYDIKVV